MSRNGAACIGLPQNNKGGGIMIGIIVLVAFVGLVCFAVGYDKGLVEGYKEGLEVCDGL